MPFIVLCSSRGTTFQSVIDRMREGALRDPCLGLVTDREDRGCVEKARKADIPIRVVPLREGESREAFDLRVHAAIEELITLRGADPRQVTLAAMGWMFIVGSAFVSAWRDRIINVHPSLLPKFGGKGMYGLRVHQAVLDAGEKESGITMHLVDDGVDTGKILLQKKCPVFANDTAETLQARVQELEREWYPRLLGERARGIL
jgi:phosphoribosylglycinamide formyltransferase 1